MRSSHGIKSCQKISFYIFILLIKKFEKLGSLKRGSVRELFVPRSRTSTIRPRAFAVSSPSAWNSLPVDLRDPGLSLLTFRRRLKTYLFNPPGYLSSLLPI